MVTWLKMQQTQGNENVSTYAYLANVDVLAISINLGVVRKENGRVQLVVGSDLFASVSALDNVGAGAVLASISKADLGARNKVGALFVDDTGVDCEELVTVEREAELAMGHVVKECIYARRSVRSGRNTVADFARLNGVLPRAVLCESYDNTRVPVS
jgi:hypothetical protein